MKLIPLSRGLDTMVDDWNYEMLIQWKWYAHSHGGKFFYAARRNGYNGDLIRMHRLIMHLENKKLIVDHIDRNSLNNQESNLRIATYSQNQLNKIKTTKITESRYKGVRKKHKKWEAKIVKDGKFIYLGLYTTEEEAGLAYNNGAVKYFGSFAQLNPIQ